MLGHIIALDMPQRGRQMKAGGILHGQPAAVRFGKPLRQRAKTLAGC
jgi:hypothetical protein